MGDVREFYSSRGWRRTGSGEYLDTALFVDTRPVMAAYRARSRTRLKRYLAGSGSYFLDAAAGANPAAEYSTGYRCHVCVDFAQEALVEARGQLGERGRYVRADVSRLPFRDASFQAAYSGHTLYHIPPEPQRAALHELARSLAAGAPAVIVYVAAGLNRLGRWLLTRLGRRGTERPGQWVLPRGELERELRADGLRPQVYVHQVPHHALTRALVPDNRLGRALLALLSRIEDAWPKLLARVGYTLLIVVRR